MDAREEIFGRLRSQAREVTPPVPWQSRRVFADLAGQFTQALTAVAGEVVRTGGLEEARVQLARILDELHAERVVLNGDAPEGLHEPSAASARQWFLVGRDTGDLQQVCAQADVGVSGAEAALAETGSVVIASGPGQSRLATLLPPVHIALVPTSRLTADLFTWTAARRGDLPANITLVSGPSKTADIEQTLAIGVHGPKRFIVILYDD